jgi:hypothetical protein
MPGAPVDPVEVDRGAGRRGLAVELLQRAGDLGSGRILVSELEAPSMFVALEA